VVDNCGGIDLALLSSELQAKEIYDTIGGHVKLAEIAQSVSTSVNIKHHALEVRRLSEVRAIQRGVHGLVKKQSNVTIGDMRGLVESLESKRYVNDYIDLAKENMANFKANLRTVQPRVKTHINRLDTITGGLRLGTICTIGAYPSTGKTALALNMCDRQDFPVVIFSLEMSSEMIYERIAAADKIVDYGAFSHRQFTNAQLDKLDKFADSLGSRKQYVIDDLYYVEQHADITSSIKPGIIVVDFVQNVLTHTPSGNKRVDMENITQAYKRIAKSNKCLVILLSQLTRPPSGANKRPNIQMLKETGALEADSDVIMLLYRPEVFEKDNPDITPEQGDVTIGKNKFGMTGMIDLHFEGKYQRFYEVDSYGDHYNYVPKKRDRQDDNITGLPFMEE
jgi:replicative DNA helicase